LEMGTCDEISWTICWSWPPTMIPLISASWVARITGTPTGAQLISFTTQKVLIFNKVQLNWFSCLLRNCALELRNFCPA
jgi:hypothetical protein